MNTIEDFVKDMSPRDRAHFREAYAVALSSEGVGGNNGHAFRLGAVLASKNRILAAATNKRKTHPYILKFSKWPFLHAEMNAIISHGVNNCSGASLYVCRVRKDGSIAIAKPCESCATLIKMAGIKEVKYTI